ncbi:MAG TPA: MFS transporter [Caulobacteraceae bacterium]|nr:MFS transporter [Caulobacteraceae bacterium]
METAAVSLSGDQAIHSGAAFNRAAWFTVWMAMLGTMCCSTSVVLINVGVFMKPLSAAFGWGRGDIALSLSIGALSMAAFNPFVGRLIDHYGVKPVLVTSLLGYGTATAAVPFMVQAGGLPGLYFGYILIAGIGAGSNVIAYVRLLSGWFSGSLDGSRGLALGISSAGVPLGATITAPLGVLLIEHFGWRGGYWGLALLPICIGLPVALFAIRVAPGEHGGARASLNEGRGELPGMTVTEAMGTRAFWLMIGVVLLMSSCLQGISIHTAPLLSDFGLKPEGLALVLAINGVLGISGRVGAGYLFDRFFAPWVSVGIFGVAAAASFALVGIPGLVVAVASTMLVTVGSGAESDFVGYLVGRYFGLRCYGQIFGAIYGMFMVGIAIGPYLFGVAFDHFGSYKIPFTLAGLGLVLLCVLLVLLPRFETEAAAELAPA